MQISPVIIQDDKLLQLIDTGKGFSFSLFCTRQSQNNSFSNLDLLQTEISSLNDLPQFKSYFDTLQQLKLYIQQPSYLKASKDGKVQVYTSHPIKKNQNFKIGEIKLKERTQNNEQDFSLINRLCMSERDLQNHEIKSILLRLGRQLEKVSGKYQYQSQNCESIKLIQTCHEIVEKVDQKQIISNQGNIPFVKMIEESLQKEMGIFRDVIVKKMELLSNQIERNKQFVLDQIGQIKQKLSVTQKQLRVVDQEYLKKFVNHYASKISKQLIQQYRQQQLQYQFQQQQQQEEDDQELVITKIENIVPSQQCINILAKVLSVQPKGRKVKAILGDQTAIVEAFLPNLSFIKVGNILEIESCMASLRRNFIQLVLNKQQGYVNHEQAKEIHQVNLAKNISLVKYQQAE